MPRTKQSQRSQAAKKRVADRMDADPAEALPPLKKSAELPEHCVYHNESENKPKNTPKNTPENTPENKPKTSSKTNLKTNLN